MKRISLCVALVACMPGLSQAYYGYGYGVRYSPYAFGYHSSGLIPCDVQYTPYAFSYHNSGLVYGYGLCEEYGPVFAVPAHRFFGGFRAPAVRHAPPVVRGHAQVTPRPVPRLNRMDIIRQHLRAKGFASPGIDRILRVDNQLVSVDFYVKDRNLLIKYWNPQELEQINTKEGYQQKAYAKYKENWERYAQQYRQAGVEIYTISAAEPEAIVAALDSCTKLGPELGAPSRETMYAKQ
jgi:hypothetical protein